MNEHTRQAYEAFFLAVIEGKADDVIRCLKNVDVRIDIDKHNFAGASPLHLAAAYGHVDVLNLLLSRGAKVDNRTSGKKAGATPLIMAAMQGKLETVKALVAANADRKHKYENKTAADWAHERTHHVVKNYLDSLGN
jgi:ankyrin repeat protein